jgi:broad specificity phosphatase PhoE
MIPSRVQLTIDGFMCDLLIAGQGTRLYLVGHAESVGNVEGHSSAYDECPLTDAGGEQAGRLAQRFRHQRLDAIFSSPLRRTIATAEAVAQATGLPITTVDGLIDIDLGDISLYKSFTAEQLSRATRGVAREQKWDSFPAGEGSLAARRRITQAIDRIVAECGEKHVAVVTHGHVIMTYVSVILGLSADFFFYPFNASITSVHAQGDRRVIWRLNDVAHLGDLDLEPTGAQVQRDD